MKAGSIVLITVLIALSVFTVLKMNISEDYHTASPFEEISVLSVTNDEKDIAELNIEEDPDVGELPREPYDYSSAVPESARAEKEYFDKCVFIGDSRMVGLLKYTEMNPIDYTSVGFSLAYYDYKPFVKIGDSNLTVRDALRKNDDYNAIYFATGVNELGWSFEKFSEAYENVIDDIKLAAGERPVYVQLILPVTAAFEKSKQMNPFGLQNGNVERFNTAIRKIAEEKQIYVLDCSELFVLEDGTLDPKQSSDGAHLTLEAYNKQYEYYSTHIAPYTLELWEDDEENFEEWTIAD